MVQQTVCLTKICTWCNCEKICLYCQLIYPWGVMKNSLSSSPVFFCELGRGRLCNCKKFVDGIPPSRHILHECLYPLCQAIQAVDRKTMILVLASENRSEHRTASTIFTVHGVFWISAFLRSLNLLPIIPKHIFYYSASSGKPVIEFSVRCRLIFEGTGLHNVMFHGKCIICNKEIGNWLCPTM